MVAWCRRVAEDPRFQAFILGVIVFNAVLMGLETSRPLMHAYGPGFAAINAAVQAVFVAEIVIRLLAHAPRLDRFFTDGWNVFDFIIVTLSLLPVAGPFATVSRLARLLRVTRVVSLSPDLRLIIGTMLRSIPSLGNVAMLLGVLIYVYAIAGFYQFNRTAPEDWGTLGAALLSVFQMLTLEGWVEMQAAVLPRHPYAWIFFGTFVVIGIFIVLNLFIAVVLNNLEKVQAEERAEEQAGDAPEQDLLRQVEALKAQLDAFETVLRNQRQQNTTGAANTGSAGGGDIAAR
uniref:Ion transport domain-containing protein n=1 Tax=uncultured Armatimonadetes bacterium TaxID=157466 RepID=A0A6J4HQB7_9BACT|nr:hypothetical protein AVDCRST_MAG63-956 [uncultured Armatimonadetes bacterium]